MTLSEYGRKKFERERREELAAHNGQADRKPSRSMGTTAIEWTDIVWNPVTGCDKVSPGCDHCYAERIASRRGKGFPNGFALTLHPERLRSPLHKRKPKRIFVNSMSDLFHDGIPDDYIAEVFAVMAEADWHTFQVLTKRPGRMRSWTRRHRLDPLPNVWLGVSAEDQKWADIRIPVLLDTPAAVRWVSAEPLLGPINLGAYLPVLDWIVVGGESGPGHRRMEPGWAREIRDQCVAAAVPFHFKQWGGPKPDSGGRELDGRTWDEYPDDGPGEPPDDDGRLSTPQNTTATAQPPSSTMVPRVARLRRILDKLAEEIRARGLVGEERLAQTLYLVLTSRLLDKQVSAGVKGHSASGKSYTVETVTRFFPPEAYLEFTGMSERALVYSTEDYAHRTLIVYEVVALREGVEDDMTSYFVRSLLSEGRIDYEVTIRAKDGGFTTRKITKNGPTNLIFTTTKTRVHAENETRILSLATDDSRAQTGRVLAELAHETNGDHNLQPWHELQSWLATAEHRVTIPYANSLAARVPPVAVRLRRDFKSLLALIRAHAVLHQASRDRDDDGRIVAILDDYAVVRALVADVIAEGVGATVSDTVRDTVSAVEALAPPQGVMALAVAKHLDVDKSNATRSRRRLCPQPGGQTRQAGPLDHRRPAARDGRPAARSSATRNRRHIT